MHLHPGDFIEWWCKDPFNGQIVPFPHGVIFVRGSDTVESWREFPSHGVNLLVGIDHQHITWLNGGRLYAEKRSEICGSFPNLTGSVWVFPRAVQT
jgi:hypothetical protein